MTFFTHKNFDDLFLATNNDIAAAKFASEFFSVLHITLKHALL